MAGRCEEQVLLEHLINRSKQCSFLSSREEINFIEKDFVELPVFSSVV